MLSRKRVSVECLPRAKRNFSLTIQVTLRADEQNKDGPKTVQKRVQIIMNCSCMSCEKVQSKDCEIADENTSELPTDLFSILHPNRTASGTETRNGEDVPELLHFDPPNNRSEIHHRNVSETQRFELNADLLNLLKAIQEESDDDYANLNYDRSQLRKLLETIEGAEHKLTDKNLMEFVNSVNIHNSDDFELDLNRLKEVLTSFRRDEDVISRHRAFGLGNAVQNANINRDLDNFAKKYNNNNFGFEGSHLGMGHYKGSHIGMGISQSGPSSTNNNSNNKNNNKNNNNHIKPEDVSTKIHHHVGDQQRIGSEHGHLIKGPHNSIVFEPEIEEKLNIDSNMVKPNQEGLVISYENHPKN